MFRKETNYDKKDKPKHIYEDRYCKDCLYYESLNWNPKWGERYCHHPNIFRTGLINTSRGCEKYIKKENRKNV